MLIYNITSQFAAESCILSHMWQDIVIAIAQWILLAALVPTLFSKMQKPTLTTSLLTASGLAAIAFSLYSLSLLVGAVATAINSILWFTLAWQRWKLNRAREEKAGI